MRVPENKQLVYLSHVDISLIANVVYVPEMKENEIRNNIMYVCMKIDVATKFIGFNWKNEWWWCVSFM